MDRALVAHVRGERADLERAARPGRIGVGVVGEHRGDRSPHALFVALDRLQQGGAGQLAERWFAFLDRTRRGQRAALRVRLDVPERLLVVAGQVRADVVNRPRVAGAQRVGWQVLQRREEGLRLARPVRHGRRFAAGDH
nr:hypothetical protein [Actinoallomurus iriomotensis]